MQRVTSPDAVATLPAPLTATTTPGFFNQTTNPVLGTTMTADMANSLQEEIVSVITAAGITLDVTQNNQLLQAIQKLGKTKVTAPLTIYVSPTGSDSNNGLTSGSPYATIQAAINNTARAYNLNDFQLTISLGNGTYAMGAAVVGLLDGQGSNPILITGSSPSACTVNTNTTEVNTFAGTNGANISLQNMTLNSAGTGQGGCCVVAQTGSTVNIQGNITFGTATNCHMICNFGGNLSIFGNYSITGSSQRHLLTSQGGGIIYDNGSSIVVTVSGSPHFSAAFAQSDLGGSIATSNTTFVGSATGMRYLVTNGGGMSTQSGGPNFFPGDTASSSILLSSLNGWYE